MGDYFQVIADVEAAEAEAPALAASIITWLVKAQIIASDRTDCVLGAESGYPPGPRYASAVTSPNARLPRSATNGVEVHTSRTFFYPMQAEVGPATCLQCGHRVVLENPSRGEMTARWELFGDALEEWMTGGPGLVTCPHCQHRAGINDWQWAGDWPIVVGFLGLKFWNWPPLTKSFVAAVGAHLRHRVVYTAGKL